MKKTLLLSVSLLFVLTVFGQKLPFQGKLFESGEPVNGNRTIEVGLPTFSWIETHVDVQVTDGLYFIVLGSINPLPENMFGLATERQLTISVDGTALSPVTLFKPLAGEPDGLDLHGPSTGLLQGGFSTGSAQNENLPFLKFRGNIDGGSDRILMKVFGNLDNTFESCWINTSTSDGQNSFFAPDYLTLMNNGNTMAQLLSQNWSNKGFSGYLLLRGPNSSNFEIGSKHWENSDLPWFNMLGTASQGLLSLEGEKYTDNGVEKERGLMKIYDTDQRRTFINSREIMLLKPDWSPYLSLNSWGDVGQIELKGTNSSNITMGAQHWIPGKGADRPIINLNGSSGQNVMELSCSNDDTNEEGIIRLNSQNGKQANLYSGMFELRNSDKTTAIFTNQNWGNGDFGKLELYGPHSQVRIVNENNVETGLFETADWGNGSFGRLQLNGSQARLSMTDINNSEKIFMGLVGNNNNGENGGLSLRGPNPRIILEDASNICRAYLETTDWGNGSFGRMELRGANSQFRIVNKDNVQMGLFETTNWGGGDCGRIQLSEKGSNISMTDNGVEKIQLGLTGPNYESGRMRLGGTGAHLSIEKVLHSPIPEIHMSVETDANGDYGAVYVNGYNSQINISNGNIYASGTITAPNINQSSDRRLKQNIQPLGVNILDKIKSLEGVSYYWRKDEFPQKNFSSGQQIGLIAQELEAQFPALVKTNDDGFKSVNYNGFTAVLLQAVKELNTKVEKLESENQKLLVELSASASNRSEIGQLKSQMEILTKLVTEKSATSDIPGSTETASTTGLK